MFGIKSNQKLKTVEQVARLRLMRLRHLESYGEILTRHTLGKIKGQIEAYEDILEVLEDKMVVLPPKE